MRIFTRTSIATFFIATLQTFTSSTWGKDVLSFAIEKTTITFAATDDIDFAKIRLIISAFSEHPIFSDDIKNFAISPARPQEPKNDTPYIQLIFEKPMEMRVEATGSTRSAHINLVKDAFKDQGISLFHMRLIKPRTETEDQKAK